MNEKGVSNNPQCRGISDWLDNKMEWEGDKKYESRARGFIHGVYHETVGLGKLAFGNWEGCKAEYGRAFEQYSTVYRRLGSTPPRSKK